VRPKPLCCAFAPLAPTMVLLLVILWITRK
jgi:hypothetical protein